MASQPKCNVYTMTGGLVTEVPSSKQRNKALELEAHILLADLSWETNSKTSQFFSSS